MSLHAYLIDNDFDLQPVFVTFSNATQFNDINCTIAKTDTEIQQCIIIIQNNNGKKDAQMAEEFLKNSFKCCPPWLGKENLDF